MLRWASMHLGSRHPLFPGQSFAIQLGPCSRISSPLAQKGEACPNPKRYPIYQPGDGAYDESSYHNLHHLLRLLLRSLPSKGTCCSIVTEQKGKSRLRLGGNRGEDATRPGYGYGYYCPLALASVLASSAAGRAMYV